ncbi:MAG: TlpA family protein disulfide reductase [Cocleimonas sp.]|nr:TlpA family protein disulfide reductase [Cocleimonas sp.]
MLLRPLHSLKVLTHSLLVILLLTGCEPQSNALFDLSQEGSTAQNFTLPTIEGETLRLSDYKGKLVLLNFWAVWCPPCRAEIPDFIALQKKYQAQGFTFIGIGLENLKTIKDYSQRVGINYPVTYGQQAGHLITAAYGNRAKALPYSILISRDQKILKIYAGLLSPTRLSKVIEQHL